MRLTLTIISCMLCINVFCQPAQHDQPASGNEMEAFFTNAFKKLEKHVASPGHQAVNTKFIEYLVNQSGIPCLNGSVEGCVYGMAEIEMWQRWYDKNKAEINWTELKSTLKQ